MSPRAVGFEAVDIIFGDNWRAAAQRLDEGGTRAEILEETGAVIGVADATLEIAEGEICVLMGLSGSGKSTLLRAVNGLNAPRRGRVLVRDGEREVDVTSCDAKTLRALRAHRVAMVFQQFALLPWRTVAQNVGLGLELAGVGAAAREAAVREKLVLVGLQDWADKYAHELSGGMQQRVGLARAFATDADILLMDEPFSALDPLIRSRLQDELLDLQHRLRKTIIFVSHDLDEALKLGDRIAIMEDGRIVQEGPPETIVLEPANDYVADFVAHMNPLRVLRGSTLMTAADALGAEIGGGVRLTGLSPLAVADALGALSIVAHDGEGDPPPLDPRAIVAMPPSALMWRVIEARQASGRPVLLVEDGRLAGVVGDEEIYRGILRQTGARSASEEGAA